MLSALAPIFLSMIKYEGTIIDVWDCCPYKVIQPAGPPCAGNGFGDIISVAPYTITDQTGAQAIPAATEVMFGLQYNCGGSPSTFPIGLELALEATVLAPTAATVRICASQSVSLFSCISNS